MKVIPIFWLSVPDEGYSNLLTEGTWWRLFQSFDWVSGTLSQKIGITLIRYTQSKDWNNLHQVLSQKIGITFIRYTQSKDWNNLHQVIDEIQKLQMILVILFRLVFLLPKTVNIFGFPIFWLSTWWRLFQSFDWVYLMKVIPIFWLSVPDEGYSRNEIGIPFIRYSVKRLE
jgi:hypothetical protein